MSSAGLELKQDPAHERREWRIQRIGWLVMFAIMVAALAGAFAVGPLSDATVVSADGTVTVHHARFARVGATTELRLDVATSGDNVRVALPTSFVADVTVDAIQPEPDAVVSEDDSIVYAFATGDGSMATITFDVSPQQAGLLSVDVGVEGSTGVSFRQFVYP